MATSTASLDVSVAIPSDLVTLSGDLSIPEDAAGLVLFAHGSGSSRRSPRNRLVSRSLTAGGVGTLLLDLLSEEEEEVDFETRGFRFDIGLLARRLSDALRWVSGLPEAEGLPIGFFGASTGSAAALVAAAEVGSAVKAIVSRGGRPDLAGAALSRVRAATLLIVGGRDETVLRLNQLALADLRCEKELVVVPGATHLFEETGALPRVADLATGWFVRHLGGGS